MKTAINQSITVLSLFTLTFAATLAISWGITRLVYPLPNADKTPYNKNLIMRVETEVKQDFTRTFKYLIPRLK